MITILVSEKEAGSRLDRVLRKRLPLVPLAGIYALIRRGGIRIAPHRRVGQEYRLVLGERIDIDADAAELAGPRRDTPDARIVKTEYFRRHFSILHEDDDLLVCNKPAGLVVHPGTGHLRNDTLVDLAGSYLLAHHIIEGKDDFALVHRLDRETSGAVLIAKNKTVLRQLHELFRERSLTKRYIAICHNRPPLDEGEIRLHLLRGRDRRGETTMRVEENARRGELSCSRYRLDAFSGTMSRVEVFLRPGKLTKSGSIVPTRRRPFSAIPAMGTRASMRHFFLHTGRCRYVSTCMHGNCRLFIRQHGGPLPLPRRCRRSSLVPWKTVPQR